MGFKRNLFRKLLKVYGRNYLKVEHLNFSTAMEPRWGHGKPAHPELSAIMGARSAEYRELIEALVGYKESYARLAELGADPEAFRPGISNASFEGFDAYSLYSIIAHFKPRRYVEVGSGNSTMFTRRAIKDFGLSTKITSIDPKPYIETASICDEVIRKPLQDVEVSFFEGLKAGDVLFIDNSHRCYMNSDVTAFFLDILPRLAPGVIVQVHDIFLPYDYPALLWGDMCSEQYLLGAYLLGGAKDVDIMLPIAFVHGDKALNAAFDPLRSEPWWAEPTMPQSSFWMVMK